MRRMLLLIALTTPVLACGDKGVTDLQAPNGATRVIQDATTANGGNAAFFWLAPIMKTPSYSGVFNPLLKPKVEICALTQDVDATGSPTGDPYCGSTLAEYTMASGTDGNTISVSTTDQHYKVNWQTKNYAIDPSTTYRVQVFLTTVPGSERLGFADVVFAENMQAAKNLTTGDEIALVDGSTLPITFRIEEGVSCNGETDCTEAVVGPQGDTLVTPAGLAGVVIPQDALKGDLLITIRRINPTDQPWGDCLPTGLRQEEGCYEFDTEPAISAVNGQDSFMTDVTVAVCLESTVRPENLTLHKYDSDYPANGVVELAGATSFLSCPTLAFGGSDGLFGRMASAARRMLRPVADVVLGKPLYATDTGRGGTTDAFSFIGWAEPAGISATAPTLAEPDSTIYPAIQVLTTHNHTTTGPVPASGVTLRLEYRTPAGGLTVLDSAITNADGIATPAWTLSTDVGTHVLSVSTRKQIGAGPDSLIVDPTAVFTVEVGGYTTARACVGQNDCTLQVVGPAGDTVTTPSGRAGVAIPDSAVDHEVLIRVNRIDTSTQPCLPTQLRQADGCYEFDTEPALHLVNNGLDAFRKNVVVGVCLEDVLRPGNMTLHKYDPEYAERGVQELVGTTASFLTCDQISSAEPDGVIGRLAAAARVLTRPVTSVIVPRQLYATDTGRGGVTDAFSFFGWAEPVTLSGTGVPAQTSPDVLTVDVHGLTAHNHSGAPVTDASGHGILAEWIGPEQGGLVPVDSLDNLGNAQFQWDLSNASPGTHVLKITTRRVVNGVVVTDPTDSVALAVEVVACTICSVSVSPETADLLVGDSVGLTATAYDGSGAPTQGSFTWASSNAKIAGVSSSGVVTAVSAGVAVITATETGSGLTDSATVTVHSPTIFAADFQSDSVGEPPVMPNVGTWSLINNDVKVASGLGDLSSKLALLTHPGGSAVAPDLQGTVAGTPPTSGVWAARWTYVSNTAPGSSLGAVFGPVVIRGSGGILAAVEFRGDGNGDGAGEITLNSSTNDVGDWTRLAAQTFELTIDLDSQTVSLAIDGVTVARGLAFVQAATSLAVIGVEVGLTVAQQFGWDNVQVVRVSP